MNLTIDSLICYFSLLYKVNIEITQIDLKTAQNSCYIISKETQIHVTV